MKNITFLLKQALTSNKLSCDETAQEKLIQYLQLLLTWNKVYNLTAITDPKEMVYLHLIDSLAVAPFLHGSNMLDVGSGAGLPGIPLAIVYPKLQWTLLDKNSKKTRFMTQVIAELGLKNVTAAHARCEDFQAPTCFDSILSRAFGTLTMFTETTAHLLCPDGVFIAMKGKFPETELTSLPERFQLHKAEKLEIQGMDAERHVICLRTK